MIVVEFMERCCGIKITNDKTFTEVIVHARDYDHENEIADKLINELIKDYE